ncbi:right-handed parallel beta-helix repeat-containing protein [Peribacillus sp. JNUCC 23]
MEGKIKKVKYDNEYVYPITVGKAVYVNSTKSLSDIMRERGSGFASYVLDLDRWGVRNDVSDFTDKVTSQKTSQGINNAIEWASQNGYVEVILPKGIYLVDENVPIEPLSFMTLNLGGSILRVRDNELPSYVILGFTKEQKYSRITNGKIEGDRYTHNYVSGVGNHEFGVGVSVGGGSHFISIDNVEILNTTGDAINTASSYGQIPGFYITSASFEKGSINPNTGALEESTSKIRFKDTISMDLEYIRNNKYFGLYGDGYGGFGTDITVSNFDVAFYKKDNSLVYYYKGIEFYDDVPVPEDSSYARLVFNQSGIPANVTMTLRSPKFPYQTFIEKCNLHHCRRQGLSIQGKFVYIRDNQIHHIEGTPPQGGIDIEDGYAGNQYIFIDSNYFYGNRSYDIVMKSARNVRITNNRLSGALSGPTLSISTGCERITVANNTIERGDVNFYGEVYSANNTFYQCRINAVSEDGRDKENLIDNCIFKNSKLSISKVKKYLVKVNNCTFIDNNSNNSSTITFNGEPQSLSNCTFKGDIGFIVYNGNKNGWVLDGLIFADVTKELVLPSGNISNCIFDNCITINLGVNGGTNHEYYIDNCKFNLTSTLFNINFCKSVSITDSKIIGLDGYGFRLNGATDLTIKRSIINYPSSTSVFEIFRLEPSYNGNEFLLDGNELSSNSNKRLVDMYFPENIRSTRVTIKNNIFTNINTLYKEFNPTTIKHNNIINGVADPYYKSSTAPVSGLYKLGQVIKNSNPVPGGFIGWICTTAGYVSNKTWTPSTNYTKDTLVYYGDHVYQAQNNGTSGSNSPTFPNTSGGTVIDNNITWIEVSNLAVFKQFGPIQT